MSPRSVFWFWLSLVIFLEATIAIATQEQVAPGEDLASRVDQALSILTEEHEDLTGERFLFPIRLRVNKETSVEEVALEAFSGIDIEEEKKSDHTIMIVIFPLEPTAKIITGIALDSLLTQEFRAQVENEIKKDLKRSHQSRVGLLIGVLKILTEIKSPLVANERIYEVLDETGIKYQELVSHQKRRASWIWKLFALALLFVLAIMIYVARNQETKIGSKEVRAITLLEVYLKIWKTTSHSRDKARVKAEVFYGSW